MSEELKERAIEIRSEEIDEILGKTPSWMLRRGIAMLSLIILFILAGSWFFHYPDIISAPVIITSGNPPTSIVARSGGKIVSFYVKDKQQVKSGDYLAILENNARIGSINSLRLFFQHTDSLSDSLQYLKIKSRQLSSLGELQQPYTAFIQVIINYQRYEALSFNTKKIKALQNQISLTNTYIEKLKGQRHLQGMNLSLAQSQFRRDSSLFVQKVITPSDFERSEIQLIVNKSTYQNSEMALSNSQIQISQLEQQIIELRLTQETESKQLLDEINNSYKSLKSQFDAWENQYVLKSTTSGKVSIGNYWSVNQNVKAGDVIMAIIPDKKEEPFGKITLGMENSGKIKSGQKVNIKLANFPYTEYGMLAGKVKSLSLVPDQGNYYVEIELSNGLITNYNTQLPFLQEMTGTAEIVTEDMRLIERIIAPMRSLYNERLKGK